MDTYIYDIRIRMYICAFILYINLLVIHIVHLTVTESGRERIHFRR